MLNLNRDGKQISGCLRFTGVEGGLNRWSSGDFLECETIEYDTAMPM